MTNLGLEWSCRFCCKHYVGRQSAISRNRKHYVGRQSDISVGASLVSRNLMLYDVDGTSCGQIVPSHHNIALLVYTWNNLRRNIVLPVYTWYNLTARLHCLCTLGTISPQYCTACVHLIQSHGKIALLVRN
jgi:hypothetical protein